MRHRLKCPMYINIHNAAARAPTRGGVPRVLEEGAWNGFGAEKGAARVDWLYLRGLHWQFEGYQICNGDNPNRLLPCASAALSTDNATKEMAAQATTIYLLCFPAAPVRCPFLMGASSVKKTLQPELFRSRDFCDALSSYLGSSTRRRATSPETKPTSFAQEHTASARDILLKIVLEEPRTYNAEGEERIQPTSTNEPDSLLHW